MSFKWTQHFLIRPNKHMKQKIAEFEVQYGAHSISLLNRPTIWSLDKGQREFPREALVKMKFFFLMDLHDDYLKEQHRNHPIYKFLKHLLGEPPYREQIFDLWWIITEIYYGDKVEAFEASFREQNLGSLVMSEHPVIDQWLERFRKSDG